MDADPDDYIDELYKLKEMEIQLASEDSGGEQNSYVLHRTHSCSPQNVVHSAAIALDPYGGCGIDKLIQRFDVTAPKSKKACQKNDSDSEVKMCDSQAKVLAIFKKWDPDGTGVLSHAELAPTMQKLGLTEAEVAKILVVRDKNGVIDYQEFLDWIFAGSEDAQAALSAKDAALPLKDKLEPLCKASKEYYEIANLKDSQRLIDCCLKNESADAAKEMYWQAVREDVVESQATLHREKTRDMVSAIEEIVTEFHKSGKSLQTVFNEYARTNQSSDGSLTDEEFALMLSDNMKTANRHAVQDIVKHASRNGTQKLSYDTVFKGLVVEFVAQRLQQEGQSFREVFQDLDPHCYGFASASAIRTMLLEYGIKSEDTDSFLDIVDHNNSGRISYTNLFKSVWSESLLEDLSHQNRHEKRTLKAVVIITRHGARFPLKSFPNSSHWPKSKVFWEGTHQLTDEDSKSSNDFAGRLTPVGCEQHLSLGKCCRNRWIDKEQLMDVNDPTAPSFISVYTSNSDRTLKSAQSFLLGMFPEMPPRFVVNVEEKKKKEEPKCEGGASVIVQDEGLAGIPILVAGESYTNLLHGFKCSDTYESLKAKAFEFDKKNGAISKWANDPKYVALVHKLWDMTGFKKMNPKKKDSTDCLSAMQSIAQAIGIERSHSMPLLRSSTGLVLTLEEEETIMEVAGHVCNLRYCGNDSQMQKEMARHAAGMLPSEIANFFTSIQNEDHQDDDTQGKFKFFSAHDNTIMAMLAHLGFKDFDVPEFAAFLAFELHKKTDGSWCVRFMYNPDPQEYTFPDGNTETGLKQPVIHHEQSTTTPGMKKKDKIKRPLQYIKLPEQGANESEAPVVSFCSAEAGEMDLDNFIKTLMVQRRSFVDQKQWDSENPYGLKQALHELEALHAKEESLKKMLEEVAEEKSGLEQRIKSMDSSKEVEERIKSIEHSFTDIHGF